MTCKTCEYEWNGRKNVSGYCSVRCYWLNQYDAEAEERWRMQQAREFTKDYLKSISPSE